jgi:PadR family transcriptional regulator PadR
MTDEGWPSEWLRGILPLCVLAIVIENDAHGYAIAQRLADYGVPNVKGGTLYPLLNRLENEGLVSSHWAEGPSGPGRKLYSPTSAGRASFNERSRQWLEFCKVTETVLTRFPNEEQQ